MATPLSMLRTSAAKSKEMMDYILVSINDGFGFLVLIGFTRLFRFATRFQSHLFPFGIVCVLSFVAPPMWPRLDINAPTKRSITDADGIGGRRRRCRTPDYAVC